MHTHILHLFGLVDEVSLIKDLQVEVVVEVKNNEKAFRDNVT